MSQKPVLVIMAAGMGSRYGGLKQIDPVDREGDLIIDFSIFDAVEADSKRSYLLSRNRLEKEFKEHIETAWKSTCRWSMCIRKMTVFRMGLRFQRDASNRGEPVMRFSAAAR